MELDVQTGVDGKGSKYIEWKIGEGGFKRAWIQHRTPDKDWAGTGRYLNVVRIEGFHKGPAGNATDFPIFSDLPDEQILRNFVIATAAVTGLKI
ncbi:MAG: hypothetical protein RIC51_03715 [Erythrobacter sp.]|uniref:hypothetical protein n=1 Tax=Erythrobacter sp. TaxID=1042 RepID=UPI0032EC8748